MSVSHTHTHTHTHTYARTHARTHTHAYVHAPIHTHTNIQSYTHIHARDAHTNTERGGGEELKAQTERKVSNAKQAAPKTKKGKKTVY